MNTVNEKELYQLLEWRIRKYTSNESTSVTNEKASQILKSTLYCMNNVDEEEGTLVTAGESLEEQFRHGLRLKKDKMMRAKELYVDIIKDFYPIEHRAYMETVQDGIPDFFKYYDLEFDAANHILTLDYPLWSQLPDYQGIDLIYEYLKGIAVEQHFLQCFRTEIVVKILRGYHRNYEDMFFNIAKVVFSCALLCHLRGKEPRLLNVEARDRIWIGNKLNDLELDEFTEWMKEGSGQLFEQLGLETEVMNGYCMNNIESWCREVRAYEQLGALEGIFPSVVQKNETESSTYVDGEMMDDERLRTLIDEMQRCRYLSDKITMIIEHIKSLRDLKELLETCFDKNEYKEIFALLSKEEIDELKKGIEEKQAFGEELKEWEEELL